MSNRASRILSMYGSQTSGPFTPASVTSATLVGWWDADDASTITLNGSTVSAWANKSTIGQTALTQTSAAAQPFYDTNIQNGRPGLRFQDSTRRFTMASDLVGAPYAMPCTIMSMFGIVYSAVAGSYEAFLQLNSSGTNPLMNYSFRANIQAGSGRFQILAGANNTVGAANVFPQAGSFNKIVTSVANGTSSSYKVNNVSQTFSPTTLTTSSGLSRIYIPLSSAAARNPMYVYETLVFSGLLSANDEASCYSYLSTKWAPT